MKPLFVIALPILALGLGAFTHHISAGARAPARNSSRAAPVIHRSPDVTVQLSPEEAASLAGTLVALKDDSPDSERAAVAARLKALTSEQFPLLCEEVRKRETGKAGTVASDEQLKLLLVFWYGHDPEAAAAWEKQHPLEKTPDDPFTDNAWAERGLEIFADSHPAEARRFLSWVENKESFCKIIAVGLVRQSPDETAAWIKTLSRPEAMAAFTGAANLLLERDPAEAVAFCVLVPGCADGESGERAFHTLSHVQPAMAAAALLPWKLPDAVRDRFLPGVMEEWLKRDRPAALAFIDTQAPTELTGVLRLQASHILEDGNVDSARDFALSLPEPALRLGACREVLRQKFVAGSSGTAEWIAAIPDPALREALQQKPALAKPGE